MVDFYLVMLEVKILRAGPHKHYTAPKCVQAESDIVFRIQSRTLHMLGRSCPTA